ncbi:TetR/AcrR family transcriptional regulator [Nocardiopsis sp. MG754419]|uniref:TetR/AcrR family transcriptional regulator n=1 Tax=Nocardiopsis sp. MG754419 TaxID=2259865 RepID=UPI001BAB0E13|nr:TetR/AcrR family transcriptional regulator [Nocardiopsis sp. MG754419]MBR8742918.1 TetR/AcrR family transcriptional regulator [Nocardiopsis sp. MG754419]
MPRTADHAQRRAQISRAVREIIADDGLDALTVARTAARAGISVGLVQHYFRSKDDMLLHAYEEVSSALAARVSALTEEGVRHERSIARIVCAALVEYLPLDPNRRAEHRVTRALAARALDNPRLAEVDARAAEDLHAQLARAIGNGVECGEVDADLDRDTAAARLAAVVEGLATQVHRGVPGVADRARAVARTEVDAVFTGRCRQYDGAASGDRGRSSDRLRPPGSAPTT